MHLAVTTMETLAMGMAAKEATTRTVARKRGRGVGGSGMTPNQTPLLPNHLCDWSCSSPVPTAGSFSSGAAPPQRRRGVGGGLVGAEIHDTAVRSSALGDQVPVRVQRGGAVIVDVKRQRSTWASGEGVGSADGGAASWCSSSSHPVPGG